MAVIMNSLYCTESTTPRFLSLSGSNCIVKFVETSKTVVVVVVVVVIVEVIMVVVVVVVVVVVAAVVAVAVAVVVKPTSNCVQL